MLFTCPTLTLPKTAGAAVLQVPAICKRARKYNLSDFLVIVGMFISISD